MKKHWKKSFQKKGWRDYISYIFIITIKTLKNIFANIELIYVLVILIF